MRMTPWGPNEYTRSDAARDLLAYVPLTAVRDGKDVVIAEGPRMAPKFWRYRLARELVLALRGIK